MPLAPHRAAEAPLRSFRSSVGNARSAAVSRSMSVRSVSSYGSAASRSSLETPKGMRIVAVDTGVDGISRVLEPRRSRQRGSEGKGRWARVAFMGGWDRDDDESGSEDECVASASHRSRSVRTMSSLGAPTTPSSLSRQTPRTPSSAATLERPSPSHRPGRIEQRGLRFRASSTARGSLRESRAW
eukprot:TRINITY_DN13391_c0_g2_i1.p2 TRINITY_DN13391_c0_g2~~TRINITY_DN13391_c0_g2_i1.p2  ORF type:complete len:185 (+),score=43.33 TRINITY_DN13391_c0_g2_i1:64-618(+)